MANITKDPEILNEALGHIRTMRDTWKEVMRLNKVGGTGAA
jgi:flagellar protein FliS